MLRRRFCAASAPLMSGAALLQQRCIRTQIPPRPAVTVIAYLDHNGNVLRGKEESELSLIRTRDNKFYLQRVYPNETVVRFLCPGLQILKNASNFEYFSIADLDHHGGVIIPSDVMPLPAHEPPSLLDAVWVLNRCEQTEKFTRKQRRSWHRRLHAHWTESPEKYQINWLVNFSIVTIFGVWFLARYYWLWSHGKSFFDEDVPLREPRFGEKGKGFGDRHPEHCDAGMTPFQWSPAQHLLSQARSDMRGRDAQDTTGWSNNFLWKLRHAWFYRHWPRDLHD